MVLCIIHYTAFLVVDPILAVSFYLKKYIEKATNMSTKSVATPLSRWCRRCIQGPPRNAPLPPGNPPV